MTTKDLIPLLQAKALVPGVHDAPVSYGYSCDLLSWVMARGQPQMAWVTVQTHLNVIAVASLHEMSCVILPDGITMEEAVLKKAQEENIAVLSSPFSAYHICGLLFGMGLPGPQD